VSLSDHQLASDIAQKTWLKVYEKPQRYQATAGFKAWLFRVGRNALIDEFRKQNRLISMFEDDTVAADLLITDICSREYEDVHEAFDAALTGMPLQQREAFCLQQEGFSLEQIAEITHYPKETIKTRIRYAREILRRKLEKYYE
jgi:RNA polymerase sigma-70 factor (ECF subfamily)